MNATTQDEFEVLFRKRSLILHRPKNDPHRPPRFFQCVDFSRKGLEQMLAERTGEGGTLEFYRSEVKKALSAWTVYNARQPRKLPAPVGVWQEALAKLRAKIKVVEAECRTLNKLLDEANAKEVQEVKAVHRKPLGHMKMRDGVLAQVDGRPVVAGEDGEFVFEDDKTSVLKYLDDLKKSQREKAKAKAAANKARHDHLVEFYGTEGKKKRAVSQTV